MPVDRPGACTARAPPRAAAPCASEAMHLAAVSSYARRSKYIRHFEVSAGGRGLRVEKGNSDACCRGPGGVLNSARLTLDQGLVCLPYNIL